MGYDLQKEPDYPLGNGFYWEYDEVSNGFGGYKTVNVYLRRTDDPGFERCIVDWNGEIQDFPGYENDEWRADREYAFDDGVVGYVFTIYPFEDGKARVKWVVQPDGRYFADDGGFGAEHCRRITMYSELDEEGKFTRPFSRN